MKFRASNLRPTSVSVKDILRRARPALPFAAVLLAAFVPALAANAQSSPSSSSQSSSSSTSSQSASPSTSASQSASQSSSAAQPAAAPEQDSLAAAAAANQPQSLADAARKAHAQPKPKPKHVYTDDDLSSMGGAISVVGDSSSSGGTGGGESTADAQAGDSGSSDSKDEAYWRGRAQQIKDQIAEVDRQIEDKKAEIAKAGPTSFDPNTGLSQGVIIVHDRNAELKDLEDRKQSLENQLDELADEGRKAGADSGWFR
ncbi:MAG TPA: hypothetical protein VMB02_17025 [Candidatus Aquilonibacter sp.]|nr:hypothetical protein [Candidatus Aquilonibacter sp.]